MIKELVEFGQRIKKNHDALREESFSIYLAISTDGKFEQFIYGDNMKIVVESIARTSGIKPRLLLDNCEYVLGIGRKGDDKQDKCDAFVSKIKEYQHLDCIAPILKFYEDTDEKGLTAARAAFIDTADKNYIDENITFKVGDYNICHSTMIHDEIKRRYDANLSSLLETVSRPCSICGRTDFPVVNLPHGLIKRVPNGQTSGCALVSFNANAYESYGLKGNDNSSICTSCACNYVNALNYLLANGETRKIESKEGKKSKEVYVYSNRHKISGGTVALFWTKNPSNQEDIFHTLDDPNDYDIKNMLESFLKEDKARSLDIVDTNMYYCCTISGAAARVMVRDWIALSSEEYKRNLAEWFSDIAIVDSSGKIKYNSFSSLLLATRGKSADSDAEGRIGTMLWSASLKNEQVPLYVLSTVLKRIYVAGQKISSNCAALIKLIVNRSNKSIKMKSELDSTNQSVAYQCGRLFAVIEQIQYSAIGDVSSSVRDRFFASASSMPAATFGRLLSKLTSNHLSKIKQNKQSAYFALTRKLSEISSMISAFPARLSLIEQGQFALGYYHQVNDERIRLFQNKEKLDNNQ